MSALTACAGDISADFTRCYLCKILGNMTEEIMARPSKKTEIVQAAAELFSTKGYRATTVRDIAERAGMLSGSLYAHIEAKEDLLIEIVRQAADQFARALTPIMSSSMSPAEKLTAAIHAHMGVIADSRAWSTVYLDDDTDLSEGGRLEVRHLRKSYERYWAAILDEGQEGGDFCPQDSALARLLILSALNGLHRWYKPEGPLTVDEIAERYAAMLLKMLR
jgi:AcrR family transcriptional regulator